MVPVSVRQALTCDVMGQTHMFTVLCCRQVSCIKQKNKIKTSILVKVFRLLD